MSLGVASVLALGSCSKDDNKSLSELKSEQSDAIEALQGRLSLSFVELKDNVLPQSIDKNVYYHLKNGLYVRVLDAGDTSKKAVKDQTRVFLLIKGYQFSKTQAKSRVFDNLSDASLPEIEFRYTYYYEAGAIHYTPIANTRPILHYDALMCQGLAFPLSLEGIGDGAKLSLIIPFDMGPSATYSSGITTYVEEARYTFR